MKYLLLFLLSISVAQAHPHVLIEAGVELQFNEKKEVTALTHLWAFDEFYSSFVVQDMVGKGAASSQPSLEKLQEFAQSSLANLQDMHFFTSLKIGKITPLLLQEGQPTMQYAQGKLHLRFTLALKEPLALNGEKLLLNLLDPEFVVAFLPQSGEIITYKNPPVGCKADYNAPKSSVTDARRLGENFFAQGLTADLSKDFTGSWMVTCP